MNVKNLNTPSRQHRTQLLFYSILLLSMLGLFGLQREVSNAQGNAIRGNAGFESNTLAANDDRSTDLVEVGFTLNFFGQEFTDLYVNNNGNVTFDRPLSTFTPFGLLETNVPIIAPFFADVDTRADRSELVTYGMDTIGGRPAFGVNWIDVGYFSFGDDKLNSIQLVIVDRSDIAVGDFDFEFNYNQIEWETGGASGGTDGLGGNSARAGYSNGVDTAFELDGSAENGGFLDDNAATGLINNSLNSDVPGRYVFIVRNGEVQVTPIPTVPVVPTEVIPTLVPPQPTVVPAPTLPPAPVVVQATTTAVPECSDIDGSISPVVRASLPPGVVGINCRIIAENTEFIRPAEEVGNDIVLDRGVIHAVDVFSPGGFSATGVVVCLQGQGDILFLDAFTAPREIIPLGGTMNSGFTCAALPNVGTIVLVNGVGFAVPAEATPAGTVNSQALTSCQVTTTAMVNLRLTPDMDSDVIDVLPFDVTYTATARAGDWFEIIYLSTQGWVNATYLNTQGNCG